MIYRLPGISYDFPTSDWPMWPTSKKEGLHLKPMNPLQTVSHSVFKYQLSQKSFVSYLKLNSKTMANSRIDKI